MLTRVNVRGAAVLLAIGMLCWPAAAMAQRKVAHIKFKGPVAEAPPAFSLFAGQQAQTLRTYLTRLNQAATDNEIDAVALTFEDAQLNWAQMVELRAAIKQVRDNGKTVWVYLDQGQPMQYMLAAGADEIVVAPAGGVDLVGVNLQLIFFKNLLDKIGVQANLLQVGKFKGADEPFTRSQPSEALQGQMNRLADGLYEQMVQAIATGRNLPADQVKRLIDDGPYLPDAAVEAKLVDRVGTRDEMVDAIGKKLGGAVTVVNDYGKSAAGPALDFSNPFALFKLLTEQAGSQGQGHKIALIYIDGAIMPGENEQGLFGGRTIGADSIRNALDDARRDANVKAIVMRIDSPGGSALASDVIWQAARKAAKAKPLVISVGGMAASGGYYVAAAGETIFADSSSLVGSIGVVGGKVVITELLDKIGVNTVSISRGAHAELYSMTQPFTAEQKKLIGEQMEHVYGMFLDRVRTGRGQAIKQIDDVAQGRVFIGVQAKQNGLVDRLGGLDDALRYAAGKAKVADYQIEVLPRPKTLIDLITGALTGEQASVSALQQWQRSVLAGRSAELSAMAQLLPDQMLQLGQQLILLRQMQHEQVLTAWPVAIQVK